MIFIDSNIPMYAAGAAAPQKEGCLALLRAVQQEELVAAASAEVLQEILHRYRGIARFADGMLVYDSFRSLPLRWLEVLPSDVDNARELLATHGRLSSRDALHIAVMQRFQIREIATWDKGFVGIEGITVRQPGLAQYLIDVDRGD